MDSADSVLLVNLLPQAVENAPHHANRQWDAEFEVLAAGPYQGSTLRCEARLPHARQAQSRGRAAARV